MFLLCWENIIDTNYPLPIGDIQNFYNCFLLATNSSPMIALWHKFGFLRPGSDALLHMSRVEFEFRSTQINLDRLNWFRRRSQFQLDSNAIGYKSESALIRAEPPNIVNYNQARSNAVEEAEGRLQTQLKARFN